MTRQEILKDIDDLKAAISASDDPDEKKMLQAGIAELESKLKKLEPKPKKKLIPRKTVAKKKLPAEKGKSGSSSKQLVDAKFKKGTKKPVLKKAPKSQTKQKDITLQKGKKKETHTIATAFDKDIKDAILVLNKERYIVREKKDKKTGKTEKVKHSAEYKNARLIQERVNTIFKSSIHDIAKTPQDRKAKKEVIDEVIAIRDLSTVFLNEVDLIINNEDLQELRAIKKLLVRLVKESGKNDKEKYKLSGRLNKIIEEYKL